MDLSVVDTMLHDSPDLVIHKTEIWAFGGHNVGRKKVWRFNFPDATVELLHMCARCAGAHFYCSYIATGIVG